MPLDTPRKEFRAKIGERIGLFKTALVNDGVEKVFDQFIAHSDFSVIGKDVEAELRKEVADKFGIALDSINLVGSAKLGFSPKPGQEFRYFSDKSDIDVAIVSPDLFKTIWAEAFRMEAAGTYFNFEELKHYHFRGWIRPDKLPSNAICRASADWWNFFKTLSSDEKYSRLPVRGGLYFDDFFFRQYQMTGLVNLRERLIAER